MKEEEILKKAIEKATSNGFRWSQLFDDKMIREYHEEKEQGKSFKVILRFRTVGIISWKVVIGYKTMLGQIAQGTFKVNDFLFSHSFAKAFWGEEETWHFYAEAVETVLPAWQYHLQQMVLEEEPLKYLEKFL